MSTAKKKYTYITFCFTFFYFFDIYTSSNKGSLMYKRLKYIKLIPKLLFFYYLTKKYFLY